MKNKLNIISAMLIFAFFFVGWEIGISPLKESIIRAKKKLENSIANFSSVNVSPNYISENQYKIDILHYDLSIDLYPEEKLLKGSAVLTGVFLDRDLEQINLNFYDNMKISELTFNGETADYINSKTSLVIETGNMDSDTFAVKIVYEGTPMRKGLGSFTFGEIYDRSLVYNLSEPTFASTWFPCNDLPSDKALLDMKITNDSSATSVSNGIMAGTKISGARKTFHWKTYYPISTYLICIYSSKYESFSDVYISQNKEDTLMIRYFVLPEHLKFAKIDFKNHPKMLDFFAKTFGEYPFIKEKYGVAEFLWQIGAMEHQTITGVGSNFVSGRNFFEDFYIHELAHQWWGDAVGPSTWKDIWLNEGFATYSEALFFESRSGKKALRSTMLSKYQEDFAGTVYDPVSLFNSAVYDKGAWVLHMLRKEVGDSAFIKILRSYFNEYKYGAASTYDFKKICELVLGRDLNKFFDQWIFTGSDNINLSYSWESKERGNSFDILINLEQTQTQYENFNFPLEVQFGYINGSTILKNFYIFSRDTTLKVNLPEKPEYILLDPDSWLLANIQEKK